jgi:uncharacterized membrane-anchored protein YhcB (DUF1043 family)
MKSYTRNQFAVLALIVGFIAGTFTGVVGMGASKAARLADDVHDVKQDFDKAKVKVVDDYEVVSDKAKEAVKEVDAKELGEAATEGLKDLGSDTKEKAKTVTDALKDRMLKKLKKNED